MPSWGCLLLSAFGLWTLRGGGGGVGWVFAQKRGGTEAISGGQTSCGSRLASWYPFQRYSLLRPASLLMLALAGSSPGHQGRHRLACRGQHGYVIPRMAVVFWFPFNPPQTWTLKKGSNLYSLSCTVGKRRTWAAFAKLMLETNNKVIYWN